MFRCFSDEDEDYKQQVQDLRDSIPFAVVGANTLVEINGKKIRGRQYPWGIVEVENPNHCDFIKLRTMLITHMQDLQEVSSSSIRYVSSQYSSMCLYIYLIRSLMMFITRIIALNAWPVRSPATMDLPMAELPPDPPLNLRLQPGRH